MDISFILVEPAVPENIGASARAIKTMGFHKLCLVNPSCYPDKKASIVAHASNDVLEQAVLYNDFTDVRKDFDFLIATSAKRRRTNENYIEADDLPDFIQTRLDVYKRVGIVFGREESGLTNEEIKECDMISFVRLDQPYPSLNLSHAVMIYAFLLSKITTSKSKRKSGKYSEESLQVLKQKVSLVLQDIHIKQVHIIGPRVMERLAYLKKEDISLLHAITSALLGKKSNK